MKNLLVAVGIIRDGSGNIFLTQRAAGTHMATLWEFPGGKIEPGESAEEALIRELQEETGIIVTEARPYDTVIHTYPDVHVTLRFFMVERWQGDPYGREGQPQRWVAQAELAGCGFPPANHPVVARLVREAAGCPP